MPQEYYHFESKPVGVPKMSVLQGHSSPQDTAQWLMDSSTNPLGGLEHLYRNYRTSPTNSPQDVDFFIMVHAWITKWLQQGIIPGLKTKIEITNSIHK